MLGISDGRLVPGERLEFKAELPSESKEMLQRVISEAKVRGISKDEFYKICEDFYK